MQEREAEKDIEDIFLKRKRESWLEQEEVLCYTKWIDGVKQIAVRLR